MDVNGKLHPPAVLSPAPIG